ncbi:hypothetical protein [Mesorhizobium sp.]|uniref:hypothetical protein n=1 Tax=Mesorhizobium sp. TaxID=1871066 RepID=UPI000FE40C4E|nr:hypothetical protein [Mesorhizobium sp.]RWN51925.1 MAG: hypothetical protein EOR98_24025 [Mesorhizobium sp.]RWN73066.1 MAG: hypothetical protein EOS02_25575 [Mesorhizobium sp.]RWN76248.1 MAG: hypothetical protein EOS01_21290 [Mesorhizobium sp.]RWN85994.1 MAG: hypothetical protein EOS04_20685 [Mesorhizobium sp.]RWO11759.1 MAG: hypothetical protein EOS15_21915 [Mesorhizobium sp.]
MATTSVDQVTGYGETLALKAPCRLATTANIVLSGLQAIDGVMTAADDRVLVRDQDTPSQNGIYIAAAGQWQRARDMDSNRDLTKGTRVYVTEGNSGPAEFEVTTANPITVGSSIIAFDLSAGSVNAAALSAAAAAAEASADIAAGFASDIVSQGNVPIYATRTGMSALSVPVGISALRVNGDADPGDGGGALHAEIPLITADQPWHFLTNGGTRRWTLAEAIPTVLQAGGDKTGVTEATSLITALFSVFDTIKLPAGTWKLSDIALAAGKTLLTDGLKTIIQQKSGVAVGTRIISITGSNVTVGSLKAIGNIATDTDEQNFAIYIRGAGDISNIRIGDILAENIRGDAVYIGGLTTAKVTGVTIGNVTGNNVLRNVVSITGGEQISIGAIAGNACGYFMFDVEPNANSQPCDLIDVQSIRGHCVGMVGLRAQADKRIGRVRVGMLDLDPNLTADSTPAYGHRATIIQDAIAVRNVEQVQVGMFKARDFERSAARVTFNAGEYGCGVLDVGLVDIEDCITTDVTYNSLFHVDHANTFIIRGGHARVDASGQRLVLANGAGIAALDRLNTVVDIKIEFNGTLGYGIFGGTFSGCRVHPAAGRVCSTVRLASTANVDISTLNNGDTIDGVVVATNDVVLLKDQTAGAENGFYTIGASAPATRWNPGGNSSEDFVDAYAYVRLGTANAEKFFECTNATDPVLGTTSITFAEAAPYDAYLFSNSKDLVVQGCDLVLGRAGLDCQNFSIIGTRWETTHAAIVWAQSTLADGALHSLMSSVFNGVTYPNGRYDDQQTIATDADFTLTPFSSPTETRHTGTLTADRAVTLSTTGAFAGMKFRITRTGGGAFNLNVGTGPLKALATNTWAEFSYNGTAWYLAAYGAL